MPTRRFGVLLLASCWLGCAQSAAPQTVSAIDVNAPLAAASSDVPAEPPHLRYMGYWLDVKSDTFDHTNVVTVRLASLPDNNAAAEDVLAQAAHDGRKVIVWPSLFTYNRTERSANGYSLRPDAGAQWAAQAELVRPYIDIIVAFYLLDEPESVAYGDRPPGGYDPNLYNPLIHTATALIRSTFPSAPIALNYGNVPAGLVVPQELTWVGLESYGDTLPSSKLADLKAKLTRGQKIWVMPQAFVDSTSTYLDRDAEIAAKAEQAYRYALTDPTITGIYPFMWCVEQLARCDDSATAADPFYTVGGAMLPMTKTMLVKIGQAIITQREMR